MITYGMSANRATLFKIFIGFVATRVLWDGFWAWLSHRCPRGSRLVGLYGLFLSMTAVGLAYTRSIVAVLGHHMLVLGFVNFCLNFPKAIVMSLLTGAACKPGYRRGWSELLKPLKVWHKQFDTS